jgi:hypothetical protein
MDSSPGFDATGVTVVELIGAATVATLVEASGSVAWALLLIALVGGWIPLLERASVPAAAFALVFAAIGGMAGTWSATLRRSGAQL